jgi:hypothetical protein
MESVAHQPERRRSPFTQVELRSMWTYSDGARAVKAYWSPAGAGRPGCYPVVAQGRRAFSDTLGGDAVGVGGGSATLAAGVRAAARPWGGSYCSYQPGVDGPFSVMPALLRGVPGPARTRRAVAAVLLR